MENIENTENKENKEKAENKETTTQTTPAEQGENKGKSKCKCTRACVISTLVLVAALALFIFVRSTDGSKVRRMQRFTSKVEANYETYSKSDLDKSMAKYDKLVKKLDKCELTGKQESQVNELKMSCRGYFAQAKARILLQDFHEALDEAGDEVKGVVKEMQGSN